MMLRYFYLQDFQIVIPPLNAPPHQPLWLFGAGTKGKRIFGGEAKR